MQDFILDGDTLDMQGRWDLTYGYITPGSPGLMLDGTPAGHWIPTQPRRSFEVYFDSGEETQDGVRYLGRYIDEQFVNHSLSELGALVAETFYANRGVFTVRIIERSEPDQYFALLSGYHQRYPKDDPERIEIVGGWADIGGKVDNFTMVKLDIRRR